MTKSEAISNLPFKVDIAGFMLGDEPGRGLILWKPQDQRILCAFDVGVGEDLGEVAFPNADTIDTSDRCQQSCDSDISQADVGIGSRALGPQRVQSGHDAA